MFMLAFLLGVLLMIGVRYLDRSSYRTHHERAAAFDLNDPLRASFHAVLENVDQVGLRYPGFIIGVEKVDTTLLVDAPRYEHLKGLGEDRRFKSTITDLNDRGVLFPTHLVEYSSTLQPFPHITNSVSYSMYEADVGSDDIAVKTAYKRGIDALTSLSATLIDRVNSENYTHIMLIVVGWNTPQLDAIDDFNGIVGGLIKHDIDGEFTPLTIGVTWPSLSSISKAFYLSKAYDADELGDSLLSLLLHELAEVKHEIPDIGVVAIGHSLGARALTTASARYNALESGYPNPLDTFVGYAAAFSINRFIGGAGIEGSPYKTLVDTPTRYFYTWSDADLASKASKLTMTPHINGKRAHAVAVENPEIFLSLSVSEDGSLIEEFQRTNKIYHIDATRLMRYRSHRYAGGAHSDIFRPASAKFLWSLVQ